MEKKLRIGLTLARYLVKAVFYEMPFIGFFVRWQYMFNPKQLCYLCSCIDRTAHLPGPILEVGCSYGDTTVWLNKHMDYCGIEKPYIAIDTFSGFTESDLNYEVEERGKQRDALKVVFALNNKRWFDKRIHYNGIRRVQSIKADASVFDFSLLHDISFALIDLDLYLPTRRVLERVYDQVADGGIIVVDDCQLDTLWDGSFQAYREFVSSRKLKSKVLLKKLGIIEKTNRGI